jgi:nitrate reductase cytochrome c-type subunit
VPAIVATSRPAFRAVLGAVVAIALAVPTLLWANRQPANVPSVGGVPLFGTWPTDRKPEAVILLSGQTFGYLRPCGCSVNQRGGLERRYNLVQALRQKGWPVVGFDLGDMAATKGVPEQNYLKYTTAMKAMRAMNYAGVGIGEQDVHSPLFELLTAYAYQTDDGPYTAACNLGGRSDGKDVPRKIHFSNGQGKPPVVRSAIFGQAGNITVGAVAAIGPTVAEKIRKLDATLCVVDHIPTIASGLKELDAEPVKPGVRVLLFQGSAEEAEKVAAQYPQFDIILSNIEESEPPQFPTPLHDGKSLLVRVGQKGQNVGLVGVFKKPDGTNELHYQLVPLTEDFVTPKEADESKHPVLKLLEEYAKDVKSRNYLAKHAEKTVPHPAQVQFQSEKLSYVGSEKCYSCHAAEAAQWKSSKHSHAMEALEKYATRPKNRQFDGECVVCHSVGFGRPTGHENDTKTPHLRHVGCESCHGPGSGHVAAPNGKKLYAALSLWKRSPTDRLPDLDTLKKLAEAKPGEPPPVVVTPTQQQVMTSISAMCMSCHDPENDPKFDLNKYMPKIWHSGLKK